MSNSNQKTRVLVLGSTGRVASLLRRVWAQNCPENTEYVWVARRRAPGVDIRYAKGMHQVSWPECRVVLSLWGQVAGSTAKLSQNATLAKLAQKIAASCGADRVIHASSAAVYAPSDASLSEKAPCVPRNEYGRSKLEMEKVLRKSAPVSVILRIGNVAGAGGLFTKLDHGGEITLDQFSNGQGPLRSYVAPSTLARIIQSLVIERLDELPRTINVAGRKPVPMEMIVAAAKRKLNWRPAPQDALAAMALDVTRLDNLVGLGSDSSNAQQLVHEWRMYRGSP